MAASCSGWPVWFVVLVLSTSVSLSLSPPERSARAWPARPRRQACVDGTYEHEGRSCCMCAAGERLEEHCTATPGDRKCKPCEADTFNAHPNNQETCQPCASCSHPNGMYGYKKSKVRHDAKQSNKIANLEVAEPCTRARNTLCRCKEGHYCVSDSAVCLVCHRCTTCGSEGVKQACTATNNTVCNQESQEHSEAGKIAGIIVGVLFVVALSVAAVYCVRKKRQRDAKPNGRVVSNTGSDVEMQPLTVPDMDLEPYLPEIAVKLGWKVTRDIAMRSEIPGPVIESCQLNWPNNSEEQTLELLKKWVEKQGRGASRKLIQMLEESDKRATAEKVLEVISGRNGSPA
ncbi:unnamed protein product [Menidia menidia]|uniref:(Atlantic silverside) hypothetical protein n=1 Tax=Menidia menidia TaxID=238744 RepID=A0A8S4C0P5_9TELE|nr:unnamed protein product [Menidia menidia]